MIVGHEICGSEAPAAGEGAGGEGVRVSGEGVGAGSQGVGVSMFGEHWAGTCRWRAC